MADELLLEPRIVFTDGACSGNPGPGGWAWAVAPAGEPWASGGAARTTNQRMEIQAALENGLEPSTFCMASRRSTN